MTTLSGSYSQPVLSPVEILRLRARANRARSAGLTSASLVEWSIKRRAFLAEGVPFDLTRHHYMTGIYADPARVVVVYKGAQMGASEWALSYSLWTCDARDGNVLYVMPTDDTVSDFSASRLGPALEASPYLDSITRGGAERGADRVTLKRIRNRFLFLRGGQVGTGPKRGGKSPQLKSVPADAVVLDEFDEMDKRVKPLAAKRLGHSRLAEMRIMSTPTSPGVGIHAEYLESDQRAYFVPCERCGKPQPVGLDNLVVEWDKARRPIAWNTEAGHGRGRGAESDAMPALLCIHCHKPLDLWQPGEWVAAERGRDVHGYHLSGLLLPGRDLLDIVRQLRSTDESKRGECFNQDLGLPYVPLSAKTLDDEIIAGCVRDYSFGPFMVGAKPARLGGAFAGIDVGGVFHVIIRGADWSLRFAGSFAELDEVIPLMREHGVACCVIDANPETREARRLQAKFRPGVVWLCRYDDSLEDKAYSEIKPNADTGVINAARTRTLDGTIDQFRRAARGEQGATLPREVGEIPDYKNHLKSSQRRVETNARGNSVARYVEVGPDHYLHAENYAYIAAQYFIASAENSERVVFPAKPIGTY